MTLNRKTLITSTFILLSLSPNIVLGLTSTKSSSKQAASLKAKDRSSQTDKSKEDSSQERQVASASQEQLAKQAQALVNRPDDTKYAALWEAFVSFVQEQAARQKDPCHIFKSWKALTDAGLKVIDPVGANNAIHIYVFNRISQDSYAFVPQTKYALIQWNEQLANRGDNDRRQGERGQGRRTRFATIIKTQPVNIPSSVDVKEANLLPHMASFSSPVKATGKKRKRGAKGSSPVKVSTGSKNHYLALLGLDQQSNHTWLVSLKQTSIGWTNYPDLFQDIPPFLIQSNSAKLKFCGNNLQINMGGGDGYELVMPFTEDHFSFSSKEAQDSASAVAKQFLMALQYKKEDLAKVWLADPKLVSIPGYLGLFRPDTGSNLRLVSMPAPICGGSRFRLITSTKDDLVLDVAKVKNQWLIKGLFIAPAGFGSNIGVKTNNNSTVN